MKRFVWFAVIAMTVGLPWNSYAANDEKVIGLVPSPEGDYQKLGVTENLKISYGAPQPGKVLIAVDNQGHARWAHLTVEQISQVINLDSTPVPGAPDLPGGTRYYNDNATAQKICQGFSMPTVMGVSGIQFSSPGDNYTRFWNGNKWETASADGMNSHIQTITCGRTDLVPAD